MHPRFIKIVACLACTWIAAAVPSRVVWRELKRIEIQKDVVVLKDTLGIAKPQERRLPTGTLWASWRPEGLYALVQRTGESSASADEQGNSSKPPTWLEVLVQRSNGEWEVEAKLPPWCGNVRAALPLKDGRLFLVPNHAFLGPEDGSGWFPFAIWGPDAKGLWTRVESVYLDWGPPFKESQGPKGEKQWSHFNHKYAFLTSAGIETPELEDRLFELDSGWAFVDRHHGLIWIFNDEGKVRRRIEIYEELKDEDLDKPLQVYPMGILACESAPDDHLILAGRSAPAFFFSRLSRPIHESEGGIPRTPDYRFQEAIAAKEFSEIQWWEVDTSTGRVWNRASPKGAPARYVFRPEDPNWNFHFQVDTEGQVSFPNTGKK